MMDDKSDNVGKIRKNHTVAQTLIKRWRYDKRYVYAYLLDESDKGVFAAKPKDVAFKERFYLEPTEEYLGREVENPMGLLWDRLTHKGIIDLDMDARVHVARYILMQCVRVPMMKELANERQAENKIALMAQAWQANLGQFEDDFGQTLLLPVSHRMIENAYRGISDDASWVGAMSPDGGVEGFAKRMAESRWTLCEAVGEEEFICTDAPVVLRDSSLFDREVGQCYYMPLGPRWMLEIADGLRGPDGRGSFQHRIVAFFNAAFSVQSRAVYGRHKDAIERYTRLLGKGGFNLDVRGGISPMEIDASHFQR